MSRRAAIAALLKDLTPGDAHVPSPVWPAPKKNKRRRLARMLSKLRGDTDPGLYVCRPLTPESAAQLSRWWASRPESRFNALDDNLHVTIVHSKVGIPWDCDPSPVTLSRSNFLGFKTLGTDRALVLRVRSPALHRRWSASRSDGAVWDYAAYEPHITLFYLGAGYDSIEYRDGSYPPLPPFDLTLGPEICSPLATDVFKWDSVEGFLRGNDCLESLSEAVHNSWMEHNSSPEDVHHVPYAELDERAKQVDRDAVLAVLRGVMGMGFSFAPSSSRGVGSQP